MHPVQIMIYDQEFGYAYLVSTAYFTEIFAAKHNKCQTRETPKQQTSAVIMQIQILTNKPAGRPRDAIYCLMLTKKD